MPERFYVTGTGNTAGGAWGIYDRDGQSSPVLYSFDRDHADTVAGVLNFLIGWKPGVHPADTEKRIYESLGALVNSRLGRGL